MPRIFALAGAFRICDIGLSLRDWLALGLASERLWLDVCGYDLVNG